MTRLLLLIHRYTGIAVGVLMVMWCVTGVVMMYISYPSLDGAVRLAHLTPLSWQGCCRVSVRALPDGAPVNGAEIEMLDGGPVLALRGDTRVTRIIDLRTGEPIGAIGAREAANVAAAFEPGAYGIDRRPRLLGRIGYDQWTVALRDGPLYRFALDDAAGTQVYVSSRTGRAVQLTTRDGRIGNWFGSIPHWLYFTWLRHRPALWTWVIVVTSGIGGFLAITGLYVGVRQWLHRPARRWSPYRGFALWHHLAGLVFGVVTLSWVVSGLLSVNPGGLLEGAGSGAAIARLEGPAPNGAQLRSALQALAASPPADAVSLHGARLDGQLYWIATSAQGERRRLSADGTAAPLAPADLAYIGRALTGGAIGPHRLLHGDRYYFGHHSEPVQFPVDRWVAPGAAATRFYVDPLSGRLVAVVDPGARAYRWWFDAPHRLDFAAILRGRPQWDLLMWVLLVGATLSAATGTYLGYRRLTR